MLFFRSPPFLIWDIITDRFMRLNLRLTANTEPVPSNHLHRLTGALQHVDRLERGPRRAQPVRVRLVAWRPHEAGGDQGRQAQRKYLARSWSKAPPEAVQFAWQVGVGELTGSGFGALK